MGGDESPLATVLLNIGMEILELLVLGNKSFCVHKI